ncbi:MAG TPA: DUF2269 family protein [Nocardioidaceae bacterium]|nr:DUF2269 family protein [Nocardioidaceae bacterium]
MNAPRSATATGTQPRRPWRLSASARKLTLTIHIITALGWIGVDFVLLVFAVTGMTSDDPTTLAMCYRAIDLFAVVLLLPLGLLSLASGLLLGWGSKYGILRYRWVFWKLVLNLVLTTLVVVLLRPAVSDAADAVSGPTATLNDRLDQAQSNLIFPPTVSITALTLATVLAVYKPWGRTKYGRRRLEEERRQAQG